MNLRKLKAAMIVANVSVDETAKALHIDPATVYRKLSGKTEFVVSEVIALRKLLHLTDSEVQDIFFNIQLTEMQD